VTPADVYWAVPETPGWTRLLGGALDPVELERAGAFAFAADRDAFVAAHVLVRLALAAHARSAAATGFASSLSHARSIVACAVGGAGSVGVDVEPVASFALEATLLEQVCSPAERAALERCDPSERPLAFTRLWTLKEAIVKARGTGLREPLPEVASAAGWVLTSMVPLGGHVLALARPAGSGTPVIRQATTADP